jgi:L-lactate dehydrogenase (cytochrome)
MNTSRDSMVRPGRRIARRLDKVLALDDLETLARAYLPRPVFGYVSGGAENCSTLSDNRAAFAEYHLLPRALVDVSKRTQKRSLFGTEFASAFGISPLGSSALSAYRGDVVLARGAARANIPMVMSGGSLIPLEEVARAAPGAWFQAYLPGDDEMILAMMNRVERAGFATLVLTVDFPVAGNRENALRSGFSVPLRPSLRLAWDGIVRPRWMIGTFLRTLFLHGVPHFENITVDRGPPVVARNIVHRMSGRDNLNWRHVDLIRARWKGRLVIKGILTVEDALLACRYGADGVVVSNHGGRQLDGSPSPMRVLPAIADAVGGRVPVMMDGGIRRGTDVLKAMALGADFVFLGRPFIYAASIAGEFGVAHVHRLLAEEIDRDMALLGITDLSQVSRDRLLQMDGRYPGAPLPGHGAFIEGDRHIAPMRTSFAAGSPGSSRWRRDLSC